MSEQDGSPSGLPEGVKPAGVTGMANGTGAPSSADATGPIERASGGRTFAGRFQLLGRRGTATDVALFEAIDIVADRSVAVKIVHPDICALPGFEERFTATMSAVAAAPHPNLTEVIDIGTSTWSGRTVHYVVCENLTAGSLRDLRDRGRSFSPSQVVMIGLDACRGLDAAHRAGFVHGDIRPANLVFGVDGRVRLADVGLADLVSDSWWVEPTGVNIEKAKFASPEQAQGLEPTTKSDVYALCLCLLEAVTGQLPFIGDSSVATLSNRVDKLLPVSADLGPLAAVLERAGRPDPDDRSSASEFGRALHQAAEKLPRPAPLALVSAGLFAFAPSAPDSTSPGGISRPPAMPDDDTEVEMSAVAETLGVPAGVGAPGAPGVAGCEPAPVTPPIVESALISPLVPTVDVASSDLTDATTSLRTVPLRLPRVDGDRLGSEGGGDDMGASEGVDLDAPDRRSSQPLYIVLAVLVVAAVVGGAAVWWSGRTQTHEVPELALVDRGEALNMISEFGWNPIIADEADDEIAAGVVIRTDPPAGAVLEEGADITFVVSTGPAPRVLPDIVGDTVEQATTDLLELGLVLEIGERAFSDDVAVDEIMSWSVPDQPALTAGDTVVPGTSIVVVVSAGPAPRVVPELAALPLADAIAAVEALDLVAVVSLEEFSNEVPVGAVIAQEPVATTALAPGATVSIVVSKGPDLVSVPALGGLTVLQATDALAAAGLGLGTVTGDPVGVNVLAEVGGVSIGSGAAYPRGTAIDLTFEVPAPPAADVAPG